MIRLYITVLTIAMVTFPVIVFADVVELPTPSGPFGVGVTSIDIKDTSRVGLRDREDRRWVVHLFYPTERHHLMTSYMPGTLKEGAIDGTHILTHAALAADPLVHKAFPTLFFIPGRGNGSQYYTILLENLASHGYVVIGFDQPYVSNYVSFANDSSIVLSLKDVWKVPRDRDYRYRYDDEVIKGYIGDVDFLLAHLSLLGKFSHLIDTSNLFLVGHSLGGNVAHIKGFEDDRFKGVIDIDSKITDREVYGRVGVPSNKMEKSVLFIRGMLQYQEAVGSQLHQVPKATVWEPKVEHSAFADKSFLMEHIKGFGQHGFVYRFYNWLFHRGPHWDSLDSNTGDYTTEEWYKTYCQHVVDWLEKITASRY